MGWTSKRGLKWGDTPQDFASDAIEDKLGANWWEDEASVSISRRREVLSLLLKDKKLKKEVDEEYRKEWGRPASKAEYRNLLKVGLRLGSKTWRKKNKGGK